jgi:hypothetical protein
MNLDNLTIGQVKELVGLIGGGNTDQVLTHPLVGKRVTAILPHGFIYFGTLYQHGKTLSLSDASNLRYWKQRNGGLPEFIKNGPIDDDRIDKVESGVVCIGDHIAIIPCGDWNA